MRLAQLRLEKADLGDEGTTRCGSGRRGGACFDRLCFLLAECPSNFLDVDKGITPDLEGGQKAKGKRQKVSEREARGSGRPTTIAKREQ